jgi:serine/threonine-protein kinase
MAKIPDKIDKYQIEELIATGGMGAVYKGIHPTLKRPIILKKLTLRGNATITERFRREARILMDFRNDHIVDVQDHFVQGRSHYIVMEFVDGLSVKDLLDEQRYLDNYTTAYITLYTSKALQYAHSKGVIHRDIKPGNILISQDGDIKLADFGIASTREPDTGEDTLTTDGTTLGTPAYMAPEQFENSRTVDYRADLYSLGIMMYEMLTGLKPFPGGFSAETIRLIQKGKFKQPRKVNPTVSPALQKIVRSLIKPKPKSRCNEINTIIGKLENYLNKYQKDDVKNRLCAIVKQKTAPPVRLKKKSRLKLYITSGIILLFLAGICTGFCRLTKFQKQIFNPSEFSRIQFQVESKLIPVTTLFLDDGKDIPEAEGKIIYLPTVEQYNSLHTGLKAGSYRAKTTIGDEVIWTSFILEPWSVSPAMKIIKHDEPEKAARELEISIDVHDAQTGWDLMEIALIEVFASGKFRPISEVEQILSGKVHNFRISAPGYESMEFVLNMKTGERVLHFQTELIPDKKDEGKEE